MSLPITAQTLLIEGPDATAFAEAQFSSHVASLNPNSWQFSAWLDAQGRVRALFHLARLAPDRLLLLLRGGESAAMAAALQKYVFRAKVRVTAANSYALAGGAAMPLHAVETEGHTVHMGAGNHRLSIVAPDAANDDWRVPQLQAGWPWLPPSCLDALLPASLSLHRLQGVALDKGCYPGQEIVARMHYRGAGKRHLHRVILSQACAPGETLGIGATEVGCLMDVMTVGDHIEALAVLTDEIANAELPPDLGCADGNVNLRVVASWPA
jgi:folate-binding protein YgfZ